MSKRCYKNVCYLICDAGTDLPVACVDTIKQVQKFLGVSRDTVWRIMSKGLIHGGCYVEKVLL